MRLSHGKDLMQECGNTMPDLSDLVPFHPGQVKNFYILVLGQTNNVNAINYYELTMPFCMENSVDPDQLASSKAS